MFHHSIKSDGSTSFSFTLPEAAVVKEINKEKGKGIVGNNNVFITNAPFAVLATGMNKLRLCNSCFKVCSKVKERGDVKGFCFCSIQCMDRETDLLNTHGEILSNLLKRSADDDEGLKELQILGVLAIYKKQMQPDVFDLILNLESHPRVPLEDISRCATELHQLFLTKFVHRFRLEEIETLLRVIRFNCQQIPIPDLPSTYLTCLTPTLAR